MMMQKLVIDCATGEQRYVPLTDDEVAELTATRAAAAAQRSAEVEAAAAQRQREADLAAMLAEWRAVRRGAG